MSKYIIENLNPLADVEVKIYKVSANATLNIPPNFQFLDPLNNSAVVCLGYVEPEIAPEANEMFFTTSAGQLSYQGHPGDYITLSDGEVLPVEQSGPVQYTSVPAGKHKVTLIDERDGYAYIAGEALTEVHNFPSMPTLTSIRFYTDVTSPNLVKVPNALPSSITDTSFMFYFATNFNSEIANWDVSHVTNMSYMFYGAATFNQPIGDWNTAHVSNMTGMFHAAESFNQDITQWCVGLILNTPTNFNSGGGSLSFSNYPLWSSCPRGENIITDEINFLTTDGTLSYKGEVGDVITLGGGAGVITVATNDINEFQVTGGRHKLKLVNDRTGYLGIAGPALTEVLNFPTISSVNHVRFNTSTSSPNLIKAPDILPSNITDISNIFNGATRFNQPLNDWDVSNITNMEYMFYAATAFNQPLNNWNVSKVNNMYGMFNNAYEFNQDLSQWCVGLILSIPGVFKTNSLLTEENTPIWGTCPSEVVIPQADEMYFTTTAGTLSYQGYLGDVITLSDGTTHIVNSVSATQYTVPAGKHKVKVVEYGNVEIRIAGDALIEVHNFVTLSTYSKTYFYTNIPSPNLVKVPEYLPPNINDLSFMFYKAEAFNQDISNWNTSNVINMSNMFDGASTFNQPIGSWNVSKVTTMDYMLFDTVSFTQNLSQWCVGLIPSLPNNFNSNSGLSAASIPKWGTCPRGENILPNEIHFTTTSGTLSYKGEVGDVITLDSGTTLNVVDTNVNNYGFAAGKNKVTLVSERTGYLGLAGSALTEVHNFPTLNTIEHVRFYTDVRSSKLTKAPNTLPSNITNLSYMFYGASVFNQAIGNWDVSKVTNMLWMFSGAYDFNQDLSQWCVTFIDSQPSYFKNEAALSVANTPVWGTCPRGENAL